MAQTTYQYNLTSGVAGGIFDLSPHVVDSRKNGEESKEALKPGMGVVRGLLPGTDVIVPVAASTADLFEGVAMNDGTKEQDMAGDLFIHPKQTLSVMRWGRIWVRIAADVEIEYGDPVYLIIDGDEAGCFTNDDTDTLPINATFIRSKGTGAVAPIELYNQKQG